MQIGTIADRRSIIVGAGPAGSIAGALLSNLGYQVTIVERDAFLAGLSGTRIIPMIKNHRLRLKTLVDLCRSSD